MEQAVKTETPVVQPNVADHVSVSDDGNIVLSPEASAIMEGKEPEAQKEPEKASEQKEPEKAPEKVPEKEPEKPKRKIKWQGQEVEVEPEKEEELLQKGFDYTKKTQALAAERDMITPYVGLVNAMQNDPEKAIAIAKILKGETVNEQPTQFDDPIEQLKYETRMETLREVEEKYIKPLQKQTAEVAQGRIIDSVLREVQKDPMFNEVDKAMCQYIADLPESVGRPLFNTLNGDPKSYLETYNKFRTKLAAKKPEAKPEVQPATEEKAPEPLKRETHAPLLESADKGGNEPASKALNDKIKALIKRSRAGDDAATGELLELHASR